MRKLDVASLARSNPEPHNMALRMAGSLASFLIPAGSPANEAALERHDGAALARPLPEEAGPPRPSGEDGACILEEGSAPREEDVGPEVAPIRTGSRILQALAEHGEAGLRQNQQGRAVGKAPQTPLFRHALEHLY